MGYCPGAESVVVWSRVCAVLCVCVCLVVKIQLTHAVTLKNFRNFGTQCLLFFTWLPDFLLPLFFLLAEPTLGFFSNLISANFHTFWGAGISFFMATIHFI